MIVSGSETALGGNNDQSNGFPTESGQRQTLTSDPNQLLIPLEPAFDKNALPDLKVPQNYRQLSYHPQVNQHTFHVIGYPYYDGGKKYYRCSITNAPKPNDRNKASSANRQNISDPNNMDFSAEKHVNKIRENILSLEKYCDLVYRWRRLNESPVNMVEIVHALELTRTQTNIYQIDPQSAVQVKRTLGRIKRNNRKFDLVSRMVIQAAAEGYPNNALLSRMEKNIIDLETLFARLADQNDKISITLGLGKIERNIQAQNFRPINYSRKLLPARD